MKKLGYIASYIALILVYGLANLILFLLIPEGRTELSSFWIAWSFTFPVGIISALLVTLYCSKEGNSTIVKVPLLYSIQYTFAFIYLIVGILFMSLGLEKTKIVWIVEATITVVFVIIMLYAWVGSSYISKNQAHERNKILYRDMQFASVKDCISRVNDPEISKMLNRLAQKVRFSDPMSHESLRIYEVRIEALILEISEKISANQLDEVPALIDRACVELDSRNSRCMLLK